MAGNVESDPCVSCYQLKKNLGVECGYLIEAAKNLKFLCIRLKILQGEINTDYVLKPI